jgi:hypothetical protein
MLWGAASQGWPMEYYLDEPINIVATPRGDKPLYLTTTHAVVPGKFVTPIRDVQITEKHCLPVGLCRKDAVNIEKR